MLSHYDSDHINGAKHLISNFLVYRIIVPFLSPSELMLVLASQPGALTADDIYALHLLATNTANGELFGIPVTQIQPAPYDRPDNDDRDEPQPLDWVEPAAPSSVTNIPNSMQSEIERSKSPVGSTLPSGDIICITTPCSPKSLWHFKFWNRGVSPDLLEYLHTELINCKFPLHALADANGASKLAQWLQITQNRTATINAYDRAIAKHRPTWANEASGKKLANFLSLGMYSGPAFKSEPGPNSQAISSKPYLSPLHWRPIYSLPPTKRVGWLGTGDAPLGEPNIWSDFHACYRQELEHTLTVQIPHHGAAPKNGPKFFNPALLPDWRMYGVISAGIQNNYGHPTPQVIKQVLSTGAHLEIVTEESWLGFQEVFFLKP